MNGNVGVTQIQKQPSKFKTALKATGRFCRNTLIGGIMLGATLAPTKSFSQEPSYKMPVITNERSKVLSKDNYSSQIKSLAPQVVAEGLFANEKEFFDALSNDFTPTLKQILYNPNLKDAFVNGVRAFERTNFTDLQATISVYNYDTTMSDNNWVFAWNEIIGVSVLPTRINGCDVFAEQIVNTPAPSSVDTIDNYSQTYTSRYVPLYSISTSFLTKFGSDYAIFDWMTNYSFSPEAILPASLKFQLTNVGKRWYVSPDYIMVSKISGEKWLVDAGASMGTNYARAVVWGGNLSDKPQFSFGLHLTPNALLSDDVNYYFMSTFYAMGRKQDNTGGFVKDIETVVGTRVDFNIANYGILGGTVEYNSASGNYYFVQKPTGLSAWINASFVIPNAF